MRPSYYGWLDGEPAVSYGGTPSLKGITLENFYDEEHNDGVVYDFKWKLSKLILLSLIKFIEKHSSIFIIKQTYYQT